MLSEFGSLPELVVRSAQALIYRLKTGEPAQVERTEVWNDEGQYSQVIEVQWGVHFGPPSHEVDQTTGRAK